MARNAFILLCALVFYFIVCGFDTDNAIIPKEEIRSGGPPKDGIPALLAPAFVKPDEISFLKKNERVIGVTIHGESKAYPIKILNWHEAINDTLGGEPIVVTF